MKSRKTVSSEIHASKLKAKTRTLEHTVKIIIESETSKEFKVYNYMDVYVKLLLGVAKHLKTSYDKVHIDPSAIELCKVFGNHTCTGYADIVQGMPWIRHKHWRGIINFMIVRENGNFR